MEAELEKGLVRMSQFHFHCCNECSSLPAKECSLKEVPVRVIFQKGILFDTDDFTSRMFNKGDNVLGYARIQGNVVHCVRINRDFLPSIHLNYFELKFY